MSVFSEPELVLDCGHRLGESILWDERRALLCWANIHDGEIWTWDPFAAEPPRAITLPERVGAIGLREGGGFVVALEKGFALLEEDGSGLQRIAAVDEGLPSVRLNDGRIDPAGRFVCGGMDEGSPQQPLANLYALDADRTTRALLSGISCTNSLCWSGDGHTLYFTDMPTRRIDAFDYDPGTGAVWNRRPFADLERPGLPDGSVVDDEDHLWNAEWEGGRLVRYRPDGTVERAVELPVSNPTCMTFGGPDLDILFVTSAWFGLDEERRSREPQAGGLFAFRPGVLGRKEHRYAG